METSPIVRRNDKKTHGPHRTTDLIFEAYDAMAKVSWSLADEVVIMTTGSRENMWVHFASRQPPLQLLHCISTTH